MDRDLNDINDRVVGGSLGTTNSWIPATVCNPCILRFPALVLHLSFWNDREKEVQLSF